MVNHIETFKFSFSSDADDGGSLLRNETGMKKPSRSAFWIGFRFLFDANRQRFVLNNINWFSFQSTVSVSVNKYERKV